MLLVHTYVSWYYYIYVSVTAVYVSWYYNIYVSTIFM